MDLRPELCAHRWIRRQWRPANQIWIRGV